LGPEERASLLPIEVVKAGEEADNAPALKVYGKAGYGRHKDIKRVCVGMEHSP